MTRLVHDPPRFIPRIGSRLKPLLFVGVGADGALGRRIQKGMENGNESTSKGIEAACRSRRGRRIGRLHLASGIRGGYECFRDIRQQQPRRRRRRSERVCSDSGSDRQGAEQDGQGESVSETEADETMAALWELSVASIIILKALFFFFALPTFLVACLMLVLYELLELHDRHRL